MFRRVLVFSCLIVMIASYAYAGLEKFYGTWVDIAADKSEDRFVIRRDGDACVIDIYEGNNLTHSAPATYNQGILSIHGGVVPMSVYYESKTGYLVGNAFGSSSKYRRLRATPKTSTNKHSSVATKKDFFDAIGRGDLNAVGKLLKANHKFAQMTNDQGQPPLLAAFDGPRDTVRQIVNLLIKNGASAKERGRSGWTPLLRAAAFGDRSIIETLIAHGADINATDAQGISPLCEAFQGSRENVEQNVSLLVAKGANVNVKGMFGETPLHMATRFGDVDMVKLLLAKGADVNAKIDGGAEPMVIPDSTPLHYAMGSGKDLIALLISKGADVNARDKYGFTPLHHAVIRQNTDAVNLLLDHGANVNAKTTLQFGTPGSRNPNYPAGLTPLAIAVPDIASILREHGAKE